METATEPVRDEILQKALALDAADRAFLVDELERSLVVETIDDDIAAAWSQEIDRRIAAYDRGEVTASSFEETIAEIRQSLAEHRAQRMKP